MSSHRGDKQMDCPDIVDLESYVLGKGDDGSRAAISEHVTQCEACAREISDIAENQKVATELRRAAPADPTTHAAPSEFIGPYRVLGMIGQGGMGTVYRAQQDNPRRVVALKMMRPGLVSASLMARFRHEAQVLGRLRHPGIAQIYDAGTHLRDGAQQPYFVMELVRGQSLLKFADARHLDRRARMELMARICDAVHHAHQQGVIHRDLKPDNILIDDSQPESPQPKILDFGVARIVDPESQTTTLHTSAGQIVGTVAYMSPEQANADPTSIDTRSDVYALGVICFQLVSGRLPYRLNTASVAESVRAIVQDEPTQLSTLDRSLRGDVTTIVSKALEKDKSRRYQSAAEMAADIRRHLRDEPITAHPPSTVYQLRKFARRNKGLVGGVVAAFVLLVAGIVGVTIQWKRAQHSAQIALSEVAKQRAVNSFLQEMLGAADPRNLSAEDRAKGRGATVLDALNFASKKVEAGSLRDHPEVELAVRKSMAIAYRELAENDVAEHHLTAAIELSKKLHGPDNTHAADMLHNLAILRKDQGKYVESEALAREAMEMSRKIDGEENQNFASANESIGLALQAQGKYAQAEPYYRKSLEIRRRVFGNGTREVSTSLNNLAQDLDELGRDAEAEPLYREALAIRRKVLGDHPDTATVLNNLGFILRHRGQLVEAEAMFRESLEMRQRTLGEHPLVATGLNNLGSIIQAQGRLDEAEPLYLQAMAMTRKFYGDEHIGVAQLLNNLGSLKMNEGNPGEAAKYFRDSLAMRRKLLPERHPAIANALRNLAAALLESGNTEEAELLINEALSMKDIGDAKSDTSAARALLGVCRLKQGRYTEAETELLAALEVMRPKNDPRAPAAIKSLMKLYTQTNQPDRAAHYSAMLEAFNATTRPATTTQSIKN